jgi:cupin 2 domain-containing protein
VTDANLLRGLPASLAAERVDVLVQTSALRLERIVSTGHVTPPGEWYEQTTHEWVTVLQGAARLTFENAPPLEMGPGDHIVIPAGRRHRVEWTDPSQPTVWLALFY